MFDIEIISIVEGLSRYYGLDWISFVFGVTGLYLLTIKNRIGFLFSALSIFLAALVAIIAGQYGFIAANIITFVVALSGYVRWKKEPNNTIESTDVV